MTCACNLKQLPRCCEHDSPPSGQHRSASNFGHARTEAGQDARSSGSHGRCRSESRDILAGPVLILFLIFQRQFTMSLRLQAGAGSPQLGFLLPGSPSRSSGEASSSFLQVEACPQPDVLLGAPSHLGAYRASEDFGTTICRYQKLFLCLWQAGKQWAGTERLGREQIFKPS